MPELQSSLEKCHAIGTLQSFARHLIFGANITMFEEKKPTFWKNISGLKEVGTERFGMIYVDFFMFQKSL